MVCVLCKLYHTAYNSRLYPIHYQSNTCNGIIDALMIGIIMQCASRLLRYQYLVDIADTVESHSHGLT